MLPTVEGIYRDGKIELSESSAVQDGSRVLVTFLAMDVEPAGPQYMKLGQFGGPEHRKSTEDDFKIAEWHPTAEDLDV